MRISPNAGPCFFIIPAVKTPPDHLIAAESGDSRLA